MEFEILLTTAQSYGSSIILLFLLFLPLLLLKLGKQAKIRLPPGPRKLPIIGNMNLLGPLPHRSLHELSGRYGPLMHLKLGSIETIVVSSAAMAEEIMKTKDAIFSNRPMLVAPKILGYNYTDVAFAPFGTHWRLLRKICVTELLNQKRVDSFRRVREEEVSVLVRSISDSCGKTVDLAEKLFGLSHDITTRIVFGRKFEGHQNEFKMAMRQGTSLAAGFHVGDFFPSLAFVGKITGMKDKLEKCFLQLDRISSRIIDEHVKKNKTETVVSHHEDLVDILLRVKDNGADESGISLTINSIKAVILDLFTGGTDSVSNTTEWAMTELIKNTALMKRAQDEVRQAVAGKSTVEESDLHKLSYIKSVIKETLRFHPPVPLLLPRESMERCTINGYDIPAKTRTIVNYWAIARDPRKWRDPEVFDPERFMGSSSIDLKGHDLEFIPFGSGRRVCPGISYANVVMELALAALLFHFDWELGGGMRNEELDMAETFGLTMFKTCSLKLVPILRFPLKN